MADAWAWVHSGQIGGLFLTKNQADWCVERADGCVVPMRVETAKVRHANELHKTLKNLTGLAKMAATALNTYQSAIRNADLPPEGFDVMLSLARLKITEKRRKRELEGA